jgi:hypothetical protein
VAASHAWAFRASFRRNAFGWRGTRKAIERLNEAVGEIERMGRTDPALACEGAVLLLEKLFPAVNHIDSSSDAPGNATNGVVERMVPLIAAAPVPRRVREKWPVKQPRPSETTVSGEPMLVAMNSFMASLVNGRADRQARCARPSSVVRTATTKGTLFSEPRPALPPLRSPPRYASSTSTRPAA